MNRFSQNLMIALFIYARKFHKMKEFVSNKPSYSANCENMQTIIRVCVARV